MDAAQRVIAAGVAVIAFVVAIAAARAAAPILAPTALGALMALTLSPLVNWLARRGAPLAAASGLVVLLSVAATLGGIYLLSPSAEVWRDRAPDAVREIERKARFLRDDITGSVTGPRAQSHGPETPAPGEISERDDKESGDGGNAAEETTDRVIETGERLIADALLSAPAMIGSLLYAAFLSFFLLSEQERVRRAAFSLTASRRQRIRLGRAMREMRNDVSRYLLTITAVNAGLGALAAALFWALGLPNPLLWGVMVAALNYILFIGPMIANLVVFTVGAVTYPTLGEALYPVLGLATLNIIEGQVVTPMAVGRQVKVGSGLAVFLAVAFGAWMWGPLGALLAAPGLIVVHRLVAQLLPVLRMPVSRDSASRRSSSRSRSRRAAR